MKNDFTLRYRLWAKKNGNTPLEQRDKDEKRELNKYFAGYYAWILSMAKEWGEITEVNVDKPVSKSDHARFDKWLRLKVNKGLTK